MNRYLLVMFCVLTGCSSTVQMDFVRGLNADAKNFYLWYSEYSKVAKDKDSVVDFVSQDISKIIISVSTNKQWANLIQNLPELPTIALIKDTQIFCLQKNDKLSYRYFCQSIPLSTRKGLYQIRAPDRL